MSSTPSAVQIRSLTELDISGIVAIDERLSGEYRPELWERRVIYYLRRDPDTCPVAEVEGRVVGFMLTDLRGGEFGLEESTGWIERFGVDPDHQGRSIGRRLFEAALRQFEARGATVVRTLVDRTEGDLVAFLRAVGFTDARLQALERPVAGSGAAPGSKS